MDSVIITGANSGLGKETARQLGLNPNIKKIYLFCRNYENAIKAKIDLEKTTGRKVFTIISINLNDFSSVKNSITRLEDSVDAIIMNAGSTDMDEAKKMNSDGVNQLVASNLIGHALLLNELLKKNLLKEVAIYSSSEVIRGVPSLMIKKPKFEKYTFEEFIDICDGSFFKKKSNVKDSYGYIKYLATLWISHMSREYKNIRFVAVSPGTTYGTKISKKPFTIKRFIIHKILLSFGLMHKLEVGAKRYIDVLFDNKFKSGFFYASPPGRGTGKLIEQNKFYEGLNDKNHQYNASKAINFFIN